MDPLEISFYLLPEGGLVGRDKLGGGGGRGGAQVGDEVGDGEVRFVSHGADDWDGTSVDGAGDGLSQRSSTSTASFLTLRNRETASFVARLQTLDPAATLSRGYAVVHKQPKGQPIYARKDVKAGDNLNVIVSDGAFSASVQGSQPPVRRRRKAVPKASARLFQ